MAIAARSATTNFKRYHLTNPNDFEIMAVSGSLRRVERKVFVLAAYIPPNYPVVKAKQCMKDIYNAIMDIKVRHSDPYIILAGDFNQFEMGKALEDFVDIWEVVSGPTRGDRTIDRVFSNLPPSPVTVSKILPPLENEELVQSDHSLVSVDSSILCKEPSTWRVHSYRKCTPAAEKKFIGDLNSVNWSSVLFKKGVESKVAEFSGILDALVNKHFPMKTSRRRDGDLPWLDDLARKKIKRKKAIYRDEGKSDRWLQPRAT